MVRVAIVTDGPYGERAHENIGEEFETDSLNSRHPQAYSQMKLKYHRKRLSR